MSAPALAHRLGGLEPDNLLAFLALLGLLRALQAARPDRDGKPGWRPRAAWSIDPPPLRPVLHLREPATADELCAAAAEGIATLAAAHRFDKQNLSHSREEATALLEEAIGEGGYRAELITALMSDGALKDAKIEATPLCLLFGQGHQHFLERLAAVPKEAAPPPRGRGKKAVTLTAAQCLAEALFEPWQRPDPTFSFRWDPLEDVRYALRASDPSGEKGLTQHGANRLAAIGLATLPVVPQETSGGRIRPNIPGGAWARGGFAFAWPIWSAPASLEAIRALLAHPKLRDPGALAHMGVTEVRETRRHSQVGKFMNFTPARPVQRVQENP